VANTVRLLGLPAEVQQLLAQGRIQAGHGRALLALGDGEAQRSLALRAAGEELSVRDVEEVVRRLVDQPPPEATTARMTPRREGISLAEVEEILSEQLATRVSIQMGRKRGRIVIEFGSADDLERIVSEIIGSGPGLAPSN
jgi:ParB family chromosome partitioning protein